MSSLHILYRNDKTTVQFTPNTLLSDIMAKAITQLKIKSDPSLFCLLHNNKPISLSIPFRLSGVPSGGRLTLANSSSPTSSNASTGGIDPQILVRIAIQLPDGKRLQSQFKLSSTIWDILLYFEGAHNINLVRKVDENGNYIAPVAVVMNKEVSNLEELQKSTLRKLFVSESCLIPIKFNTTSFNYDELVKEQVESYKPLEFSEKVTQILEQFASTSYEQFAKLHNIPLDKNGMIIEDNNQNNNNTLNNNQNNNRIIPPNETIVISPTPIPTITTETATSITTSTVNQPSPPTITTSPATSTSSASSFNIISPTVSDTSSNTPISDSKIEVSPTTTTTTATTTGANTTATTNIPQPIERNLTVYIPNEEELDINSIEFDGVMRQEDFQRLMEANKRIKKEQEERDSILRTKAMREREMEIKTRKYKTTLIRLYLPDRRILELSFNVHEPISRLHEFLLSKFEEPLPNIYFYITPPRKELNLNQTFSKENLYPRAKIYMGIRKESNPIKFNNELETLFTETYGSFVPTVKQPSPVASQDEIMKDDSDFIMVPSTEQSTTTTTTETSTTTTNTTSNDEQSRYNYSNSNSNREKVIPKWFLAGKK